MDNILLIVRLTKQRYEKDIKYNGIINAFRNMGYCVWYPYIDGKNIFIGNGSETFKIGKKTEKFDIITKNTSFVSAIRNFIRDTEIQFKYCYIRSMPSIGAYRKMLVEIKKKNIKIAVEIPTYPSDGEFKSDKMWRKAALIFIRYTNMKAAKLTDLYMPIGETTDKIYGRPAVNIENGVDCSIVHKRTYIPNNTDEIHLVGIGWIARWHGYERIIEGLHIYYENNPSKKVYFHIVGSDGDGTLAKIVKMVEKYKLNKYVILEGYKYADEADRFFDMADAAVASLNITGMKSVYPLKIGEYMARGVPFIYAENCTQVKEEWDFCMRVPLDNSPVDINKVIEFAKRAGERDVSDRMREIAKTELTWEKQLNRMIDFFEADKD